MGGCFSHESIEGTLFSLVSCLIRVYRELGNRVFCLCGLTVCGRFTTLILFISMFLIFLKSVYL